MYALYIANKLYSSWSLRPWVLMKERSIAFEERIVPLNTGSSWASYRDFAPNGRVPCLHHDDLVIWDSLAIVEYLAERHSGVWPVDPVARAWARSACAEMHSGFGAIRNRCSMHCSLRIELAQISPELQQDLDRLNELWQQGLDRFGGPFLAGSEFTAVDAFFAPIAFRARTYYLPLNPNYIQRLLALPSMQSWDAAACAETWIEPQHEQDVLSAGKTIADLRRAST
jgi:glutathione S-transferase